MNARTKIVCTLGPASGSVKQIEGMIRSGMDVARLNLSHGSHEDHAKMIRNARKASSTAGREIGMLLDLQGPRIRVGPMGESGIDLKAGTEVTITTDQSLADGKHVTTTYERLPEDAAPGDTILIDDGRIRLKVLETGANHVRCEVMTGGEVTSNKGINLPGVRVSAPSPTAKDLSDLEFGIEHEIDYVALSFVRCADDVRALRDAIVKRIPKGRFLPIIAKIEKPEAIESIDAVIDEADCVMVARGDLGVELSPEEVPLLQKMIVKKCNEAGKPVVIATQMLESMINNPTPTRAEASDVANAVIDGGDALMLSGETSIGDYPLEAVRMMDRIIRKVEAGHHDSQRLPERSSGVRSQRDALGRAACVLAEQMEASAIITVTHAGNNARIVSRFRPGPGIIAVTDRTKIVRRLSLIWGVQALEVDGDAEDSDTMLQRIRSRLVERGLLRQGDHVVVLAGYPMFSKGSTSFIKVETL